jgi:hypothetical protein
VNAALSRSIAAVSAALPQMANESTARWSPKSANCQYFGPTSDRSVKNDYQLSSLQNLHPFFLHKY